MNYPVGSDHPFDLKLERSLELYGIHGLALWDDDQISALLSRYKRAIERTSEVMREVGVAAQCASCAVEDGGSCCGSGIEDKFDVVLMLVNLLLGARLPAARGEEGACWFLGPWGCSIPARHVICINYLCRRIYDNIEPERIHALQAAMVEEADLQFLVEEEIKSWLSKR